jgi:hypothetical protein
MKCSHVFITHTHVRNHTFKCLPSIRPSVFFIILFYFQIMPYGKIYLNHHFTNEEGGVVTTYR